MVLVANPAIRLYLPTKAGRWLSLPVKVSGSQGKSYLKDFPCEPKIAVQFLNGSHIGAKAHPNVTSLLFISTGNGIRLNVILALS